MKRRKKIEKVMLVSFLMMSFLLVVGAEGLKEVSNIKAVDVKQEVIESLELASEIPMKEMSGYTDIDTFEPERSVRAPGDLESGLNGTSSWRIDSQGTLYIGIGELNGSVSNLISKTIKDKVTKIILEGPVRAPVKSQKLFSDFINTTEIVNLTYLDTSNVTEMDWMFLNMGKLTSLDLSSFQTSNVTNMYAMFSGVSSLPSLDLSHFNTSNVRSMDLMFQSMRKLTSLDLSSFQTSNVTSMYAMFSGVSSLPSLDLSHFNTSNVKGMGLMFYGASSLLSLDLSHFNTSKLTDMSNMFRGATGLTSLDLSSFQTSNVTSMYAMFIGTSSLRSLDLSHFNTSMVTDMNNMFRGATSLTSLDLSSFQTSNVTNMNSMFYGMTNLSSLDVSSFDTNKVVNMTSMYSESLNLRHVKLGPKYVFKVGGLLPNSSTIFPYYGKWQKNHVGQTYKSDELSFQYVGGTMAGDWYWAESKATIEAIDSTISTADTWNPAANFVSAKDNEGNLLPLSEIMVIGSVNTGRPGIYDVTYKNGGVEKKIKVTVVEKKVTLTVKHRDEVGNLLADLSGGTIADSVKTMVYGAPYNTSPVVVTGYELTGNLGNASGSVPATDFIVTYTYKGTLMFITVPPVIDFNDGQVLALNQTIQRKNMDWEMMIRDARAIKTTWTVQASLTSPLKNAGGKSLPNALRYIKDDGSEIILSSTATTLYSNAANVGTTPVDISVKSSRGKGLVIKTKAGEVERGSYEAGIKWVLVDAL